MRSTDWKERVASFHEAAFFYLEKIAALGETVRAGAAIPEDASQIYQRLSDAAVSGMERTGIVHISPLAAIVTLMGLRQA